jgi:hypothetical protein
MVTVCLRSRRRGLQRTRSGRTPLQLGQHRQPPPIRRATAGGIPCALVERTPHISPTTCRPLCDDSPEPYPLPDRRLTRERRCQIIPAESCDHLVTSTGTLVLEIRRAREECRIRSAVLCGTESWVCAARRRAPNVHGHGSETRASRLRSVSTRRATRQHQASHTQPARPPLKTRHS